MSRRAHLLPRSLLLLALLLGGLSAPAPLTHAQTDSLPDMKWISPTWGYIIRWFSNEWTVTEDGSSEGDDVLALTDTLGNYVAFLGTTDFGGDAEACLDWILADTQAQPGATDFRLALDSTGEPYAYSSPTQAYAVFFMSDQAADGVPRDFAGYIECQTLVPDEAVLERVYLGPPEVFDQWYDDIVKTLEGVYLPPAAWLPYDPDLLWLGVNAGAAPLLARDRINAAFDNSENPRLLVGLEAEAGDTRLVSFTNVSAEPVTVSPADVTLTLYSTDDEAEDQVWPLADARWEDGAAADPDGARVLAPGDQASVVLEFLPGDLSTITCDDFPLLMLAYEPADLFVEFAESALPGALGACPTVDPGQPAVDSPTLQPAATVDVAREALILATPGQLDELGRIPLVRLTLPPGASLANLPSGPLAMFIESGAVDVILDNITIPVLADEPIAADTGTGLIVRTGDDVGATLLLLLLSPQTDWTESLVDDSLELLEVEPLLPEQGLLERFAARQFALDRAALPPGTSLELGEGDAPLFTAVLIESGSPMVTEPEDAAGVGTIVAAGESLRVPPGTTIQAGSDQATELLLVEVREAAPQSGAQQGEATPGAIQSDAVFDATYSSPPWGYTIHWDAEVWSMEQETSENGADVLTLRDDAGNIAAFIGNEGYGGNATACLEAMKASVWQIPGAADYAIALNEFDEPLELRGPTQAYAFYTMRLPDGAGGMEETYFYDECQTLVAGEAVFQRGYSGPAAVYWERQTAIVDVLEGVFLPASAWLAHVAPYDPDFEYGSTGSAPLLGKFVTRSNATIVHDHMGNLLFLVGLVDEAGDTRLVSFENLSDAAVLVEPEKIELTLASRSDPAEVEVLPLLSVAWQDGTPTNADGSRAIEVGERATALLTFAAPRSAIEACDETAFTTFMYPWLNDANEERGFFGYGYLTACS